VEKFGLFALSFCLSARRQRRAGYNLRALQVSCQESALESLVDEIVVQIIRASLPGIPAKGHSLGRAAPRELGVRILR
jgi:hypothetical protein